MQDADSCPGNDACGPAVQRTRFIWADDADHVTRLVMASPSTFGAAVVFEPPSGGPGAPLDTFELRVNHTSMPSTLTTFSDFAIGTVKLTQLPDSDWMRYFWASNLLHAVERCLMAQWLQGENATLPLDIEANVRSAWATCALVLRGFHLVVLPHTPVSRPLLRGDPRMPGCESPCMPEAGQWAAVQLRPRHSPLAAAADAPWQCAVLQTVQTQHIRVSGTGTQR